MVLCIFFAKQDYHALHHYLFFYQFQLAETKVEYAFSKGDTLDALSRKFVGSGLYAIAIGRANCKPIPVEGDALIIRFYSAQKGDNIDLLAEQFSSNPDFLRSINAIDAGITLLPADQILILPGKCGH